MAPPSTPAQAERAQRAGLMNVLVHTEGWTLYLALLAQEETDLLTQLADPSKDWGETQRLRGALAGIRKAQTLPARILRAANPA